MGIKYIDQVDLEGKRVFVRADLNVPLTSDGDVADDTRIRAVAPTLKYALRNAARLIIASHLGRPKGQRDERYSMMPVSAALSEILGRDIVQASDVLSDGVKTWAGQLKEGDVMVLENVRFHPGETKNDPDLARALAEFTDVYVNDAFGSSHRAHATVDALPRLVPARCAGFLMRKELEAFRMALDAPARPFLAVLGGAKVSDKVGVIENLLDKIDEILIGGAMAYTFLKAKGENVGKSLVEDAKLKIAADVLKKAKSRNVTIHLPVDHVAADKPEAGAAVRVVGPGGFTDDEMGLDIGPATRDAFAKVVASARTVIWNGPMGVFEVEEFAQGTIAVAQAMADSDALTLIGGGDSVSAVKKAGVADKISHISTGGGASLELLEGKTLPGLAALETDDA